MQVVVAHFLLCGQDIGKRTTDVGYEESARDS